MAELVDALVSGTSVRMDVQVRVLFRAQITKINEKSCKMQGFFIGTDSLKTTFLSDIPLEFLTHLPSLIYYL